MNIFRRGWNGFTGLFRGLGQGLLLCAIIPALLFPSKKKKGKP